VGGKQRSSNQLRASCLACIDKTCFCRDSCVQDLPQHF
jgi:hypothetical protein